MNGIGQKENTTKITVKINYPKRLQWMAVSRGFLFHSMLTPLPHSLIESTWHALAHDRKRDVVPSNTEITASTKPKLGFMRNPHRNAISNWVTKAAPHLLVIMWLFSCFHRKIWLRLCNSLGGIFCCLMPTGRGANGQSWPASHISLCSKLFAWIPGPVYSSL